MDWELWLSEAPTRQAAAEAACVQCVGDGEGVQEGAEPEEEEHAKERRLDEKGREDHFPVRVRDPVERHLVDAPHPGEVRR